MTDEREALRDLVDNTLAVLIEGPYLHDDYTERIMAAADAYGDARELKGHVKACQRVGPRKLVAQETPPACGDGWHCDKAPIKEGASEHGDGR